MRFNLDHMLRRRVRTTLPRHFQFVLKSGNVSLKFSD